MINASKLALIISDKNVPECNHVGSNEQIVGADGLAFLFKASSERSIDEIGRRGEW
jgi:hypothetical protein